MKLNKGRIWSILLFMLFLVNSVTVTSAEKRFLQNETGAPTDAPTTAAPSGLPTTAPTVSPTTAPTSAPTTSPTAAPTTPSPPEENGLNRESLFGIFGILFFVLVAAVIAINMMTGRKGPENHTAGGQPISPLHQDVSRRFSNRTGNRDSLSTIFSRERLSTWSGRYSGKIEAADGMDDHLAGYIRDKRHKRNERRKRRGEKSVPAKNSSIQQAPSRKQVATTENMSIQEKEIPEEDHTVPTQDMESEV